MTLPTAIASSKPQQATELDRRLVDHHTRPDDVVAWPEIKAATEAIPTESAAILAQALRRDAEIESGRVKPLSEAEFWAGVRRPRP